MTDQPTPQTPKCTHPYTRPATVDDPSPYCVSCLSVVVKVSRD